jgi:uncharacterized protein YhaN
VGRFDDAKAGLQQLETKEKSAVESLAQALLPDDHFEEKPLSLQQQIMRAEASLKSIEVTRVKREQLSEQIRLGHIELEELTLSETNARIALANWNASWLTKTNAAGFADQITAKTASTALGLMGELKEKLREKRDRKQDRIKTMRRDIQSFETRAQTLAKAIAPDLKDYTAENFVVVLASRLNEALAAQTVLEKAIREIEQNTAHRDKAQSSKDQGETQLQPLMKLAGVKTIADLEATIERSQQLHELNRKIVDTTNIMLEQGDGLSMAALEEELATEDLTTIEAQLGAVKQQSGDATKHRDECLLQMKTADEEKNAMHGQADAATAESDRQQALAEMVGVTERFIKVRIGASLLRWAIERYRDEKRGPLLERASKIFSVLTEGSFDRLEIDDESGTPQLIGRRPDGRFVGFNGLSEGTSDQLYLSLRLAAVEMQLQHARPLPFVADDLFSNYSPNRTIQGFKVLADLATKSQVVYFTPQPGLIELARDAVGEDINIIQL